jgi:hypothetical protein
MSRRQLLAFLGLSVSYGVFSAFNNFTLTLWELMSEAVGIG